MKIVTIKDRRLKPLVEGNSTTVKGIEPKAVIRVAQMIGAIKIMTHPLELLRFPQWRAHELRLGRPGVWALRVTPNWRLTFYCDIAKQQVSLLNLEDYH